MKKMKKDNFNCRYEVEECGGCRSGRCDDCKSYGSCRICLCCNYKLCAECVWYSSKNKNTPCFIASVSSDEQPF